MVENTTDTFHPHATLLKHGIIYNETCSGIGLRSFAILNTIGTYNAEQSGSSIVSNPSVGESLSDRNSSYHDLKVHISYVCIYGWFSHQQCGRDKEKGSTPKRRHRPIFPMTGEIADGRYQTCQKDEINHHSFEFLTFKSLDNSLIFSIFASITVLLFCL